MVYYDDELDEREEAVELPEVRVDEPSPCCICGKHGQRYGCFRCGRPVCYNQQDYFASSDCGGWILDTWHNDHPEGNEFYCDMCLYAGLLGEDVTVGSVTPVTFAYTDQRRLVLTIAGKSQELSLEETRNLVAFLYDRQGDLFNGGEGKPEPEPVAVVESSVDLADLADQPF